MKRANPQPAPRVMRLVEEPDMARLIAVAQFGAKQDKVTVVIFRKYHTREIDLFRITPDGAVTELPYPSTGPTIASILGSEKAGALRLAVQEATAARETRRGVRRVA